MSDMREFRERFEALVEEKGETAFRNGLVGINPYVVVPVDAVRDLLDDATFGIEHEPKADIDWDNPVRHDDGGVTYEPRPDPSGTDEGGEA